MTQNNPKVAMITGASSGMGAAVAWRFARGGWAVALGARRMELLKPMAGDIENQTGAKALAVKLDIRSAGSSDNFVRATLEKFGKVDALINCAGLALGRETADKADVDDWTAMIETNYTGPIRLVRELLPVMKSQGYGHVINIGALAALAPHPGSSVYASAKEAMRMFLKCLREDTLGSAIRVSNIDPGVTRSQFALVRLRGDDKAVAGMMKGFTPLEPDDVARCAWFTADMPPHVNIDQITILPTDQTSPTRVHRKQ